MTRHFLKATNNSHANRGALIIRDPAFEEIGLGRNCHSFHKRELNAHASDMVTPLENVG